MPTLLHALGRARREWDVHTRRLVLAALELMNYLVFAIGGNTGGAGSGCVRGGIGIRSTILHRPSRS